MGFFDDISKESLHEAEAAGLLGASTGQFRAAGCIWSQAASVCWIQAPGLEWGCCWHQDPVRTTINACQQLGTKAWQPGRGSLTAV